MNLMHSQGGLCGRGAIPYSALSVSLTLASWKGVKERELSKF